MEDDGDEGITFQEYADAQQKALDQYSDTVKNNYHITLQEFMENQVADMVSSCILALWSYEQYATLDISSTVKNADETLYNEQLTKFAINENFDSFITSLSDSSILYTMPQDMTNKYVFVKNILIPFTSGQSAMLSDYANRFGGTDNEQFEAVRNAIATEIVAEYFYSEDYDSEIEEIFKNTGLLIDADEDSDSKYEKIEGIFTNQGGTLAINENGILGQFFGANGEVKAMTGKTKSETIVELMKRFNTDTAQHSTRYDYVVYVGEDWEDYSHSWVKEFYSAVNELGHSGGKFSSDNIGKYAMCVSTYGVHIIYVEGFVEDYTYDYTEIWKDANAWKDTSSLAYVRYKAEFDNQVSLITEKAFNALDAKYIKDGKLSVTKYFKRFLKDNEFDFDFDKFLQETLSELHLDD